MNLPPHTNPASITPGAVAFDQACNECRRRKGKCDRILPQCGPCAKSKRHCLYERHKRSPLTRKYLTEVEECLRETEKRARSAEAKLQQLASPDTHAPNSQTLQSCTPLGRSEDNGLPSVTYDGHATPMTALYQAATISAPRVAASELETPPASSDDFDWDERDVPRSGHPRICLNSDGTTSKQDQAIDGMASLHVEDGAGGYLGVASGAAMLRLLLPCKLQRPDCPRNSGKSPRPGPSRKSPAMSPPLDSWALSSRGIDLDAAIDAYFRLYHQSYPIVHEPTFRAQYSQVIPRPDETSFKALTHAMAALGISTTATGLTDSDRVLYMIARRYLFVDSLDIGNITMVQTLTLMSNYVQKRGKPNTAYNHLGLALHMAMGLGLHKEFHDWAISPLNVEIRRRVWWCLFIVSIGTSITFGRPLAWPERNIEVSVPKNVTDKMLTNVSTAMPDEFDALTCYSALAIQARFHLATNNIYTLVISANIPPARDLLQLDDTMIEGWIASLPSWYAEDAVVPAKSALAHRMMWWRMRNFRIIMYRPYVVRSPNEAGHPELEGQIVALDVERASERCMNEAKLTIDSVERHWRASEHNSMVAWYALYFLFQATLIPCRCLREDPCSSRASEWSQSIQQALHLIRDMSSINRSSDECYDIINRLSEGLLRDGLLRDAPTNENHRSQAADGERDGIRDQIGDVYSNMWPGAVMSNIDALMHDATWMDFLNNEILSPGS